MSVFTCVESPSASKLLRTKAVQTATSLSDPLRTLTSTLTMHASLIRRQLGGLIPPKIATPKLVVRLSELNVLAGDNDQQFSLSLAARVPHLDPS